MKRARFFRSVSTAFFLLALSASGAFGADPEIPRVRREIISSFHPADPAKIKVAFFDADATLRISVTGKVSADNPRDVFLLPFIEGKLQDLAKDGYLVYVVSNQGGISSGFITEETANSALNDMAELIDLRGGVIHGYDYAENETNRKPGTALKDELDRVLREKFGTNAKIDLANSFMVGDSAYRSGVDVTPSGSIGTHFSNADRKFAENIGVSFYEAAVFFGWRDYGVDTFKSIPEVSEFLERCESDPQCAERFFLPHCGRLFGREPGA